MMVLRRIVSVEQLRAAADSLSPIFDEDDGSARFFTGRGETALLESHLIRCLASSNVTLCSPIPFPSSPGNNSSSKV